MATFEAQVEGLTSLSIDGSSSPTQTELTQFLTDGAKEIITALPIGKKVLYSTSNTLNNSTTTLTLGGSAVLGVVKNNGTIDHPCRRIPSTLSGRAQDSSEMMFATATDPVWWVINNILNIFPTPTSDGATVQTLAYPAVAYGDSAITKFPDEAEYLVPIYASIKSLQNAMGDFLSNDNIDHASTGALALINIALDRIASYNWGDSDTFTAGSAQLTRVKNALDQASDIINGNAPSTSTDAFGAQSSEDIELTGSALSIAATELNRAQQHLSEWSAISGVASTEAQGFIAEAQARVARDNQKYQWYQGQQAKLQADYDKGLQIVMAG
tara:strand:+ start:174 stop:1154 length:981 start_codon:yes stop_codon:yes gene_type:complete